ncbi:MAG: SUMF1/EgtB/PvdO family nonheme iron enzyme [Verrucomicrobiota bacterium JB022]|nr:SUMF1/EgtB/PvdO family nonheme iron enzyme [Verrucomicrobiota bacterium JB022]
MSHLPYGSVITQELLQKGDRLGPYLVMERLAVHLFGALYRVDKEQYGQVLIHVLPKSLSSDPVFHKAYLGRCAKLNSLKDTGLLEIRDGDRFEERLVIEYVDEAGLQTLGDYFYDQRPDPGLSVSQLKTLMGKVTDAFKAARSRMIGHFALTPDMVMVSPKGDVFVYGFGLYESLQRRKFEVFLSGAIIPILEDDERVHLTAMDTFSPEVRNDEEFDQRADIFSLGILTYFLLTGQKPTREWVLPTEARPELTEGWDLFISRCLEPDAYDRFANLNAFGEDLNRAEKLHHVARSQEQKGQVLQNLEGLPLPKKLQQRYSRSAQNYIRLGFLVAAGVAVLGLAWMGLQFFTAQNAAPEPTERVITRLEPGARGVDLLVRTFPARASLRFPEQSQQFVVSEGQLALDLPRGTYTVEVSAPRFNTVRRRLEVAGEPVTLDLQLQPEVAELQLTSRPGATVDVLLPEGVALYLDRVPDTGTLTLPDRLLVGRYQLRVSSPGYTPALLDVDLRNGEPARVTAPLEPLPSPLQVLSQPEGLAVMVNGQRRGKTPLTLNNLPLGEALQVTVGEGGYKTANREVTLRAGEPQVLDFGALEERRGELELKVSMAGRTPTPDQLAALQVAVGDESYSGQPAVVADVRAGSEQIRVEHPDFVAVAREVNVLEDDRTRVTIDLAPKPAAVRVQLPEGLPHALLVNRERQTPRADGLYEVAALEPLQLQLFVQHYQPAATQVTIPPNKAYLWQPELKPLAGPQTGEAWEVPYLAMELLWIPAGRDELGSPVEEPDRRPADGPITPVALERGYWIAKHEVTQRLYTALMGRNPSENRGGEDLPVDSVSWRDAMQFCARLTEQERRYGRVPAGYEYRLPTEMEWEYAARAGSDAPFSFGAQAVGGEQGNFRGEYPRNFRQFQGRTTTTTERPNGPQPVGSYLPNAWGLYDVHGNVAEWTLDGYLDRLPGEAVGNYTREVGTMGRAVRGGSWQEAAEFARSASRSRLSETTSRASLGFRVVLAPVMESLPVRK